MPQAGLSRSFSRSLYRARPERRGCEIKGHPPRSADKDGRHLLCLGRLSRHLAGAAGRRYGLFPAGRRQARQNIIFGFVSQPLVSLLKNIAGAGGPVGGDNFAAGPQCPESWRKRAWFPKNVNLEVNPTFEKLREIFSAASVYVRPAKGSGIPVELLLAMSAGVAVMTDCANPFSGPA